MSLKFDELMSISFYNIISSGSREVKPYLYCKDIKKLRFYISIIRHYLKLVIA